MIYIFLLSLWPILNYLETNIERLNDYKSLFLIFLTLFFGNFGLAKILDLKLKRGINSYLFFLLCSVAVFFTFDKSVHIFSNTFCKASYIWILFTSVILYLSWKMSSKPAIQNLSKILICTLTILPLLLIIKFFIEKPSTFSKLVSAETFVFQHKPDIYYILLDGYGRQDTLKEITGFNNEPFLGELEKRGFIVSRVAYSNYHFTGASLSATMNINYHQQDRSNLIQYDKMEASLQGDNLVRKILKKNQYKIINIPAHWHQMKCYGNEDFCQAGNDFDVVKSFLSTTPFKVLPWRNNYVDLNLIKNASLLFPKEPKFIFAHLAQVHDSIYNQEGNFVSVLHPIISNKEDSTRYISSIKKMNREILELVDHIKKRDKNSVIILQADHGPTYTGSQDIKTPSHWLGNNGYRLKGSNNFRYNFGILSAVYLPEYDSPSEKKVRQYLGGSMTLINTFRCIFTYLSGQKNILLLKDESHFLFFDNASKAYKEVDIRELKKGEGV